MSNDTERPPASQAGVWVDELLRSAYPESAGVTINMIEAMAGQDSFSRSQVAYLAAVFMDLGAQVRSAADRAELEASRAANFVPVPTREARIALRTAAMAEQAEITWLRRTGEERTDWPGGDKQSALSRFGWDADRPDHVPLAGVSVKVREVGRGRYAWKDEA